ncbi:hypothetical protein FGO68_gene12396 [Halteria grandinella]|uniref:Protein kinase domain-containing protein n=1 Tax=Halteria grandinella TaxID=5974 RepID=A0A8J8T367_HALGN|nr:hypothetical protein FGO68_gene12396 [Halteria grandinella]
MFFAKIKEKKLETCVETEIKCHLKANDIEGCIHVQDIFSDKDSISLVLPYYIHGDLSKFIREHTRRKSIPQKESIVRPIFIKIAQALQRLHQKGGIVHRDLKLENILVNFIRLPDGSEVIDPVISDFGFAISREELLNDITTQRCMGTVNYFPFEMVTKVNRFYPDLGRFVQAPSYDERCDIWTLGIMLQMMITRISAFDPDNDQVKPDIEDRIRKLNAYISPEMSAEAQDLVKNILTTPEKRLTLQQIISHPWCRGASFISSSLEILPIN